MNLMNRKIVIKMGSNAKRIKAGWKPASSDKATTTMSRMVDRR